MGMKIAAVSLWPVWDRHIQFCPVDLRGSILPSGFVILSSTVFSGGYSSDLRSVPGTFQKYSGPSARKSGVFEDMAAYKGLVSLSEAEALSAKGV